MRFHALDVFRLDGYRKVLFCDSDVVFQRPVDELFERLGALVCAGDGAFLSGRGRDPVTFREVAISAGVDTALDRTFNSGVLLIDGSLTRGGVHADLLALVTPEPWRNSDTWLADQFVLNRYFAGRQTLVSSTYNYPLIFEAEVRRWEGLTPSRAKVLHFNGPVKPWRPDTMLRWMDPGERPSRSAFRCWYEAYLDGLAAAHLRAAQRAGALLPHGGAAPVPR